MMWLVRLAAVFCLSLALCSSAMTADAASPEERSFLALYFSDEELEVFSATKSLKSLASIAENVAIVTADEIRMMNAHTVVEVLYNVTGVEIESFRGPGSGGLASINGSGRDRVVVLLDGVPFHTAINTFELSSLPVQMVQKIEVIKGPASATWGSSFGGVINIITKSVEPGDRVGALVSASAGKGDTSDIRTELSARSGGFGIYLFGGRMDSDGLRGEHAFTHENFFGKMGLDAGPKAQVELSALYQRRNAVGADFLPTRDAYKGVTAETINGKADIRTALADTVTLRLSGWWNRQDDALFENQASTGLRLFTAPTLFERHGVSGDLAWQTKRQTLVLGAESETDRFKQEFDVTDPMTQKTYALYMNDSVTVGDLNVTAGLRYDFFDPVGGIASPSLGATYLASRDLLFRALVTRGFHSPAIVRSFDAPTVGYFAGNHLAPEKIWSYQAGVEGNIVDLLRAKVTLFYHDIDDILIEKHLDSSSFTLVNGGSAKSTGGEFEFATNPCKGFAFRTGVHYERIKPIDFSDPVYFDTRDVFGVDAAFVYDGRRGLTGAVKAHYLRWDLPASTKAASKGVVVDVSAAKKLLDTGMVDLELFASGHNVFNASSYTDFSERNPGRWLEIGARCTF